MTNSAQHENRGIHPWLGLIPYEESDAPLFYGRSQEVDQLANIIMEGPQTTIFGPSGVGKTSLLRAGVFPRLKERYFLPVYIRLDHSEKAPVCHVQALQALMEELSRVGVDIEPLAERVAPDLPETLWEFLHRHEFWDSRNHLLKPVLVFDQFEELFTLAGASRAERFIIELGDLCGNSPPHALDAFLTTSGRRLGYSIETQNYRVVLCLREDFLARLEELTGPIPSLRRNRFSLQAMNANQALEVVLGPGRDLVDETVARRIVEAVTAAREPCEYTTVPPAGVPNVEPALLSLFCRELNIRRLARNKDCITIDLVEESRRDILRDFYRHALESVSTETAAFIEDHLLTTSGYRNAVAVDDLVAASIPLADIEKLASERLLRFEERRGLRWVEFSHDILTVVARESRNARQNEEALRQERERTEALLRATAKERHRVRLAVGAIVTLLGLVVGLGCAIYYLFVMEHETYYHSFAKRYGFVEGIGKLSLNDVRHRQCSFKFIHRGLLTLGLKWKPAERVVAVNAYGMPTTEHGVRTYLWSPGEDTEENQMQTKTVASAEMQEMLASVCQWEFVKGEDGRIVCEKGYDKNGNMVWGLVYSPSPKPEEYIWGRFVGPQGFPQKQRNAGAEYIRITYDEHGFERFHEYLDASGSPSPGPWDAYGMRFEYNALGLLTLNASIDASGKDMTDSSGNTGMRNSYDTQGRLVKQISFCSDGSRCANLEGIAETLVSYDEFGNLTNELYKDAEGKPTVDKRSGVHKMVVKYSEHGDVIEHHFFDVDNNPYVSNVGLHGWIKEYKESGRAVNVTFLGLDSKPILGPAGYAIFRERYDERGNVIERRYYGIDGNPCLHADGTHGWEKTYDEDKRGDAIEVMTFLGLDGHPTMLADGYAMVRKKYNSLRKPVEERYFDENEKPTQNTRGIHYWTKTYDNVGRRTESAAYGLDDNLTPFEGNKIAIKRWKYNSRGNESEIATIGIDNKPVANDDGYAIIRKIYDECGNMIIQRFYSIDGTLCLHKKGYAMVRKKYNSLRKQVEERYFDENEKPTENINSVHYETRKYNNAGRITESAAYDLDDNLTPFEGDKIAIKRWQYDGRGKDSEVATIGIDNKPVANDDGYAIIRKIYDERGNMILQRFYGIDGTLCLHKRGYAIVRNEYNALGKPVEERYFDENEKPTENINGVHYGTVKYDNAGRMTELAAYDLDGNLRPFEGDKIAIKRWQYDGRGNVSEVATIGIDNKPVANDDGYAIIRKIYDERGNMILQRFYGIDGTLCLHKKGYAIVRNEYNALGKPVEERYFDENEKPTEDINGVHYWTVKYDNAGRMTESAAYDLDGNRINLNSVVPILMVAEVVFDSEAEHLGIKAGDIILEYGQWSNKDIANDPEYKTFNTELERCKDKTKIVVFYRDGKVFALEFPEGLIGIRITDSKVPTLQFEQISRAHEIYQKEKQP